MVEISEWTSRGRPGLYGRLERRDWNAKAGRQIWTIIWAFRTSRLKRESRASDRLNERFLPRFWRKVTRVRIQIDNSERGCCSYGWLWVLVSKLAGNLSWGNKKGDRGHHHYFSVPNNSYCKSSLSYSVYYFTAGHWPMETDQLGKKTSLKTKLIDACYTACTLHSKCHI